MELNKVKSQIFFFNTPFPMHTNIIKLLGFKRIKIPSKYLGALLMDLKL